MSMLTKANPHQFISNKAKPHQFKSNHKAKIITFLFDDEELQNKMFEVKHLVYLKNGG